MVFPRLNFWYVITERRSVKEGCAFLKWSAFQDGTMVSTEYGTQKDNPGYRHQQRLERRHSCPDATSADTCTCILRKAESLRLKHHVSKSARRHRWCHWEISPSGSSIRVLQRSSDFLASHHSLSRELVHYAGNEGNISVRLPYQLVKAPPFHIHDITSSWSLLLN